MTGKTFLNRVANGQTDAVALLLSMMETHPELSDQIPPEIKSRAE